MTTSIELSYILLIAMPNTTSSTITPNMTEIMDLIIMLFYTNNHTDNTWCGQKNKSVVTKGAREKRYVRQRFGLCEVRSGKI